jgi:hypothetical protein
MGGGMGGSRPPGAGPRPFAPRDPGALPTPESRRQRAKPGARKQTYEKGPRGPIKQRPVTRLYDEDEEEPVDLSEFDDPAARTLDGEPDTDLDTEDFEPDDVETEEDE